MRYIKISGDQFADKLEQIRLGNLILKILIQNNLQETFHEKQAPPSISDGNYGPAAIGLNQDLRDFRISMFNPTSLVRVGRLLLNGVFIYRPLADA